MPRAFADRRAAGRELAEHLSARAGRDDVVVLGLPRGGVPVAYEVARALSVPLDVVVVRRLGVPGHEELAMGAIASGGVLVLNDEVVAATGISQREIDAVADREGRELARREHAYRGDREPLAVEGRTAIVIDDASPPGRRCEQRSPPFASAAPARSSWPSPPPRVRLRRDRRDG